MAVLLGIQVALLNGRQRFLHYLGGVVLSVPEVFVLLKPLTRVGRLRHSDAASRVLAQVGMCEVASFESGGLVLELVLEFFVLTSSLLASLL